MKTLLLLLLFLPLTAAAQGAAPAEPPFVGAGLRLRPAYDGSRDQTVDVVPLVRYYGEPWFARITHGVLEAGARTQVARGVVLGAQLAYEQGRERSESQLLQDLAAPDISTGASAGAHLELSSAQVIPHSLLIRIRQMLDTDRGAQADLRLTVPVLSTGSLRAALFAQGTWADTKSTRLWYSAPGFEPDGGLLYAALGAQALYELDSPWTLIGTLQARRLQGDAARSPLVERKSSYYAIAGVAYRF